MLSTEPIVEAAVLQQHRREHAIPAAEDGDMRKMAAQTVEQPVARPELAGHLLVVEGIGYIGVRMLGDDARQAVDQRTSAIGGDAAREVEGPVAPIRARTTWLGSVSHFGVVSFALQGCNQSQMVTWN